MKRRLRPNPWARAFERSPLTLTRQALKSGTRALRPAVKPSVARRKAQAGDGAWLPGVALGAAGARRVRLYRPAGVKLGERLPLLVMLHGCHQNADTFAASTRMNRIAQRERPRR